MVMINLSKLSHGIIADRPPDYAETWNLHFQASSFDYSSHQQFDFYENIHDNEK